MVVLMVVVGVVVVVLVGVGVVCRLSLTSSFMPNAAAAVPHTIGLRLPRIWGTPAHKAMYLTYRDG